MNTLASHPLPHLPSLPPPPPPPDLGGDTGSVPGGHGSPLPAIQSGHSGGSRPLPPGGRKAPLSPPRTAGGQRLPVNPGTPVGPPSSKGTAPKQAVLTPTQIAQVKSLLPTSAGNAAQGQQVNPRISRYAKFDPSVRDKIVATWRDGGKGEAAKEGVKAAMASGGTSEEELKLPNGQPFDAKAADAEPKLAPGNDVKDVFKKLERTDKGGGK